MPIVRFPLCVNASYLNWLQHMTLIMHSWLIKLLLYFCSTISMKMPGRKRSLPDGDSSENARSGGMASMPHTEVGAADPASLRELRNDCTSVNIQKKPALQATNMTPKFRSCDKAACEVRPTCFADATARLVSEIVLL
jgi:hypothetical protein